MPIGSRTTIGTRLWPPNMKRALAAWLTSSSIAHSAKSAKRISTIGRVPIKRGADGRAHDAGLGDRRVDHALGPELLDQPLVLPEHAAATEILAQRPDGRIGPHRLAHREQGRLRDS